MEGAVTSTGLSRLFLLLEVPRLSIRRVSHIFMVVADFDEPATRGARSLSCTTR